MRKLPNASTEAEESLEWEAKDGGTWTALYRAVSSGQVAVIKILMEHKANAEVSDREGMTLLQTAAWNGHEDVVSILLRYSKNIDARDREGWTALHHAAWHGHARVINLLMENEAEADAKNLEGNTPLYHAAWNGHTTAVQALLWHGANVNEVCTDAETALQQAAWGGHSLVVQVLLEAGANPNAKSKLGSTALHQAATNGQEAIVKLLLDSGADITSEAEDGQTVYEAAKENSYYELARYLESCGGHVPDNEDKSEADGMHERRTGLEVDPAIAEILGLDPKTLVMQDHGDACSSEPFKITAIVGKERKYYFVKLGPNGEIFRGEHASLQALHAVVPTICPLSLGFGKLSASSSYFLLTEFLDVNAQTSEMGSGLSFAQKLATLHSAPVAPPEGHNQAIFVFPVTTYAGCTMQDNTFRRSWAKFYAENRLRTISRLIEQAHGTDDELRTWIERTAAEIVPKLLRSSHLGGKRGVSPVLVHGDLWSGNKARGQLGGRGGIEDVVFDPSCCYAHSEYELGLMRMFGGFSAGFFSEYHRLIPKTSPQSEYDDRMKLYQLYHWLNNWILFRGGYRDDAMNCMQELYAKYGDRESEEEA